MAARHDTAVKTVQVSKTRLMGTLGTNLETHKKEFTEAVDGYRDAQEKALVKLATEAAKGRKNRKVVREAYNEFAMLARPEDHSSSYEQAIALMEWEERDIIELSVNDFECYVRDNWSWQRSFKMSHANYSSSAGC